MKKAKLAFIAIALAAGVGGAFAAKPADVCEGMQQYYWTGSSYQPVMGSYGVGWYCEYNGASTCTFYRPNPGQPNFYVSCMSGMYRTVY
jgi:hypothetical protein